MRDAAGAPILIMPDGPEDVRFGTVMDGDGRPLIGLRLRGEGGREVVVAFTPRRLRAFARLVGDASAIAGDGPD